VRGCANLCGLADDSESVARRARDGSRQKSGCCTIVTPGCGLVFGPYAGLQYIDIALSGLF